MRGSPPLRIGVTSMARRKGKEVWHEWNERQALCGEDRGERLGRYDRSRDGEVGGGGSQDGSGRGRL